MHYIFQGWPEMRIAASETEQTRRSRADEVLLGSGHKEQLVSMEGRRGRQVSGGMTMVRLLSALNQATSPQSINQSPYNSSGSFTLKRISSPVHNPKLQSGNLIQGPSPQNHTIKKASI